MPNPKEQALAAQPSGSRPPEGPDAQAQDARVEMNTKLTRQGVRDLGGNFGQRKHRCFAGPMVQVGTRWEWDDSYMEDFEAPVYASKCIHCGRVMSEVV